MKGNLTAFGLLWLSIWLFFAMFLYIYQYSLFIKLDRFIAMEDFKTFWQYCSLWQLNTAALFHGQILALLTIVIGTLEDELNLSGNNKNLLLVLLISGVVIASLCHLTGYYPAVLVGDSLVFFATLFCFFKIIKKLDKGA